MADLVLLVAGSAFAGWKEISVRRSMEQCAGGFRLSVSELQGDAGLQALRAGARCELMIDGDTVITGYIDQDKRAFSQDRHSVEFTGRDATADLVDCSAIRKTGQWRGLRIEQVAAELAAPFGVPVRAAVDTGKALTSFALQEGESVFEAISRAARIRGLLLVSDGAGGLVITRAGSARVGTPLVLGGNLLSIEVERDLRDRYSEYVVKGQAPGSDFFNGSAAAQIKALAKDPGVGRYRPLIITADSPDLAATLGERALWEANTRAAQSLTVRAEVQGWRHAGGLWAPNAIVPVQAAPALLQDDLLITAVEFRLSDDGGSTTELTLTRADAFKLLPIKAQDVAQGFWSLPKGNN